MAERKLVLRAEEIAAMPFDFRHPLDTDAEVRLFPMSHATDLTTTSVSLAHLAPGHCSYPKHRHHAEDEWIYILTGTATLEMDDETHVLGTGDFAAFPAGGPAHKLTNTSHRMMTYLMGGSRSLLEVADFPEQGKRLTIRGKGRDTQADLSDLDQQEPFDYFARMKDDD